MAITFYLKAYKKTTQKKSESISYWRYLNIPVALFLITKLANIIFASNDVMHRISDKDVSELRFLKNNFVKAYWELDSAIETDFELLCHMLIAKFHISGESII